MWSLGAICPFLLWFYRPKCQMWCTDRFIPNVCVLFVRRLLQEVRTLLSGDFMKPIMGIAKNTQRTRGQKNMLIFRFLCGWTLDVFMWSNLAPFETRLATPDLGHRFGVKVMGTRSSTVSNLFYLTTFMIFFFVCVCVLYLKTWNYA